MLRMTAVQGEVPMKSLSFNLKVFGLEWFSLFYSIIIPYSHHHHPLFQKPFSKRMLTNVEILFVGLTIGSFVIWYYVNKKERKGSLQFLEKSIVENENELFSNPKPLFSLTSEMLQDPFCQYKGERDHIYVNKVLREPYFQTMSHQQMKTEDWIEIDGDYKGDIEKKQALIKTQGKVVLDLIDDENAKLGCQELMQHICDWLCIRYPKVFIWEEKQKRIFNKVTNQSISLVLDHDGEKFKSGVEAMDVVGKLVQDDFLIASPLQDGHWLCAGGLVCFPGFYLLSDKIGTPLSVTHAPVPQFNEKLLLSVERTLTRLKPGLPIERTSWEIVDSKEDQFWVPMAGPLPTKTGAKPMFDHHLTGRKENACEMEDASKLILRLDHQTFVKMPKSGIVFFGVHPFRRSLENLRFSPLLPKLLLTIHENGQKDLMKYKAAPQYEQSVIPFLHSLHEYQIQVGLAKPDDHPQDFRKIKQRKMTISHQA